MLTHRSWGSAGWAEVVGWSVPPRLGDSFRGDAGNGSEIGNGFRNRHFETCCSSFTFSGPLSACSFLTKCCVKRDLHTDLLWRGQGGSKGDVVSEGSLNPERLM